MMRLSTLISGRRQVPNPRPSTRRSRRFGDERRLESLEDRCLLSLDVTTFPVGDPDEYVSIGDITSGPDGNLWFTASDFDEGSYVGRITPDGEQTLYPVAIGVTFGSPGQITSGPDGNLWFTIDDLH